MIQYQHFNTPHHAMDTLLQGIYKDRVLHLRNAKLIEPSKYDLRKPLSKNERRQINYATNKYDSIISNNKANKIATVCIKNKKTQSLLRRKGYLQQEGYDDLSSFKKQELLSRYSFETYKF